jgi:hypothetical protein
MKKLSELDFGFSDAENYKRKENKETFNRIFIKNDNLEKLCNPSVSFLIGEKGTGKTAYSVYLSNNNYKDNVATIRYIRETEYLKFISLKAERHLGISDYNSIWKVIVMLLISQQIKEREGLGSRLINYRKFLDLQLAIDEYYMHAFSPEIVQALQFVQESKVAADLLAKYAKASGEEREQVTFSESRFQVNLFYIQKKFKEALAQLKLEQNYILFIDGIDVRPSSIPFDEYIECIKGLANAVWELNNDVFSSFKGSKGFKGRMRTILLIRPDIFDSLGMQNQNTKIRDNSVFLDWRTDYVNYRKSEIFKVIDHLLETQQSEKLALGETWDNYFPWNAPNLDNEYKENTSFVSFLRWSYYRPRDIVTMLDLLQLQTKHIADKCNFTESDFKNSSFQRQYSHYLLGEVKDHLLFYYKQEDYDVFLKFFEFLSGSDTFDYNFYINAYNKMMAYVDSLKRDTPQFMKTANDFLQFLYDLNVICYVENAEDGQTFIHWCFKERNYSNISPKVKINVEYQVFYGLRKALNVGKKISN